MSSSEAQASGIWILSTFHADLPEVILHERTELLSPEKDADALAETLERLVAKPQLWEPMATAARRHITENYNVRTQVARLEAICARLLAAGLRSGA